jgi:tetratricopeptide (TPR) repeat protein
MKRFSPFLIVILFSLLIQGFIWIRLPSSRLVKYPHAAELYLKGKLQGERVLDFSPLYLQLNVSLKKLNAHVSILSWIHIVCVALSTGLLFQLLRNHFRLWIAIAGTAVFLIDRNLIVYTHIFEPEPFLLLFIVACTYFATLKTPRAAFAAGVCFGLAILTRPNFVPVFLAIPFHYKFTSEGTMWRKKTLLFLIPALLCVGGIWARNAKILGHFSPFVMNPGTVFYEGNNPNSWGMSAVYPPVLNQLSMRYTKEPDYHHELYREFARRITRSPLGLADINSYWSAKARNFLIDYPQRTMRLTATKILHVFHSFQWHDLSVAYAAERALEDSWFFSVPFALTSALCIAGLWVLRSEWKNYLLFYSIFFSQFLVMAAIYVSARQRTAILFLFVFFACAAIDRIFVKKTTHKWILILIAVLSISLHVRTDMMLEERHLWDSIRQSNVHLSESYRLRNQGRLQEAAIESARALAVAPALIDSRRPANLHFDQRGLVLNSLRFARNVSNAQRMDQALLLMEAGRIQEAQQIFGHLYEIGYNLKRDDYQSSELQFYLAKCAFKREDFQKAVDYLEKAIRSSPGDPSSVAYLSALTGREEYKRQLQRYFDEIDVAYFLGKANLETGKPQEAVRYFQYLTAMLPEFRPGFLYLASAFGESGNYEEAATQYRNAISLGPDPVFFEKTILKTFEELSRQKNTALDSYSYGIALRQFGYFKEALIEQQKALSADAKNPEIAMEIKNLQKVLDLASRPLQK